MYMREGDGKSLEIEINDDVVEVIESFFVLSIVCSIIASKDLSVSVVCLLLASKGKVTDRERKGLQQSSDGGVEK